VSLAFRPGRLAPVRFLQGLLPPHTRLLRPGQAPQAASRPRSSCKGVVARVTDCASFARRLRVVRESFASRRWRVAVFWRVHDWAVTRCSGGQKAHLSRASLSRRLPPCRRREEFAVTLARAWTGDATRLLTRRAESQRSAAGSRHQRCKTPAASPRHAGGRSAEHPFAARGAPCATKATRGGHAVCHGAVDRKRSDPNELQENLSVLQSRFSTAHMLTCVQFSDEMPCADMPITPKSGAFTYAH